MQTQIPYSGINPMKTSTVILLSGKRASFLKIPEPTATRKTIFHRRWPINLTQKNPLQGRCLAIGRLAKQGII